MFGETENGSRVWYWVANLFAFALVLVLVLWGVPEVHPLLAVPLSAGLVALARVADRFWKVFDDRFHW